VKHKTKNGFKSRTQLFISNNEKNISYHSPSVVMLLLMIPVVLFICRAHSSQHSPPDKFLAMNVTRLLDKLLMNYSKSLRPTHDLGTPTIIETNININSLGPISNFEMTYTMDCYFRQEWKDPRLAFEASFSQISLSMKMLELIWKPDTYFLNGKVLHPTFLSLSALFSFSIRS
jgi:hypothetical protein